MTYSIRAICTLFLSAATTLLGVEIELGNGLKIGGAVLNATSTKLYIAQGDTLFVVYESAVTSIANTEGSITFSTLQEAEYDRINFNGYDAFIEIKESTMFEKEILRDILTNFPNQNPGISPPIIPEPKPLVVAKHQYFGLRPATALATIFTFEYGNRNLMLGREKRVAVTVAPIIPLSVILKTRASIYGAYFGGRRYKNPSCRDFYFGYGVGGMMLQIKYPDVFLGFELPEKPDESFWATGIYGELGFTGHPSPSTITHINLLLMPSVLAFSGEDTGGKVEYGMGIWPTVSFTLGFFIDK